MTVDKGPTLGRCAFMLCASMLGSAYRGDFFTRRNQLRYIQVPICSEHREFLDDAKKHRFTVQITDEGHVYPQVWMESVV